MLSPLGFGSVRDSMRSRLQRGSACSRASGARQGRLGLARLLLGRRQRPVCAVEPSRVDGAGERFVVALVLVGVRDGEVGDRPVERVALTQVGGDRDPVAPARVRAGEGRAAEAGVERRAR